MIPKEQIQFKECLVWLAAFSVLAAEAVRAGDEKISSPPLPMLTTAVPDSVAKAERALEHQRRLNDLLIKVKSLSDVDRLSKVSTQDRAWLKKSFTGSNPDVVLKQAIEKKKKEGK